MRARGCSTLPTAKLLRLAGQLQAVPCTTLVNSYHQLCRFAVFSVKPTFSLNF